MVLVCAVTSEVNVSYFPPEIAGAPRIEVRPRDIPPDPTLISHEQSVANFAAQWRLVLATAESEYPNAKRWHLIASAPVTIAVEVGRAIMRDAHPPVTVYERGTNCYEGVLVVNERHLT